MIWAGMSLKSITECKQLDSEVQKTYCIPLVFSFSYFILCDIKLLKRKFAINGDF